MKREKYRDLLQELGTLAFERFENLSRPPQAFLDVEATDAEEDRLGREMNALEAELNARDASNHEWLDHEKSERKRLEPIIKKWRLAIDGVKSYGNTLRQEMRNMVGQLRREQRVLAVTEAQWRDTQLRSPDDEKRLEELKQLVVRLRLSVLRGKHQLEDRKVELSRALEPKPGQKGEAGVRAYADLMALDVEHERRKHEHTDEMQRLEAEIAWREKRLGALETESIDAVVALGAECYVERVPDPAFADLVKRLDAVVGGPSKQELTATVRG